MASDLQEAPKLSREVSSSDDDDDDNFLPQPSCFTDEGPDTDGTPVFYPTDEEFKDFANYIRLIENTRAHEKTGIAKIVPPEGWHPRPSKLRENPADPYADAETIEIFDPVKERIEGARGVYTKYNTVFKKKMTIKEYKEMAMSHKYKPPISPDADWREIEKEYWRTLLTREPIYGADTPGSLYDDDVEEWNVTKLRTILDLINDTGVKIKGVNTAYLYLGMWKTTFPWHVEDMDLYSINYVHYGAPKFWYGIAEKHADRMEQLCASFFPESHRHCKQFLRHKMNLLAPTILKKHNIPFTRCICYAGEFMITFPRGFHTGFNTGYNCAESTNFATPRWVMIGANAQLCQCRDDIVRIDMRPFVKKFRPYEYSEWHKYYYEETTLNVMLDEHERTQAHEEKEARKQSQKRTLARKRAPPPAPILKLPRMQGEPGHDVLLDTDGKPLTPAQIEEAKRRGAPVYQAHDTLPPCPRHAKAIKSENAFLKEEPLDEKVPLKGSIMPPKLDTNGLKPETSLNEESRMVSDITAEFLDALKDGGLYRSLRWHDDRYKDLMNRLYRKNETTVEVTRQYNALLGATEPHCSVCQYFVIPDHASKLMPGLERYAPVKRQWHERHKLTIPWKSRCFTNVSNFVKTPEAAATLTLQREKERDVWPRLKSVENSYKPVIIKEDDNEKMPDTFMDDDYRRRMGKRLGAILDEKLEEQERSGLEHKWLVSCVDCAVTVHADCYNVSAEELDKAFATTFWRCQLCAKIREDNYDHDAEPDEDDFDVMRYIAQHRKYNCRLCRTRGGALVPVNDEQSFVHVICAMFATNTVRLYSAPGESGWRAVYVGPEEALNGDHWSAMQETILPPGKIAEIAKAEGKPKPELKQPFDLPCQQNKDGTWPIRAMPNKMISAKACYLCGGHSDSIEGVTVPCCLCPHDQAEYMHVTCAQHSGATFQTRDFPKMIFAACNLHFWSSSDAKKRKVYEGEWVNVEHLANPDDESSLVTGRARVLKRKTIKYASVDFNDGTRSEDSHLSDIYACNCRSMTGKKCDGKHIANARVKLRWKKTGEENEGRLIKIYPITYFQVKMEETGDKYRVKRDEIRVDDDKGPQYAGDVKKTELIAN